MKIRKKDGSFKEVIYTEAQLLKYGINRLSEREFSRNELMVKMGRLQPDVDICNRVLDTLVSRNFLSDERRARMIVNQFKAREGLGKIKQRLAFSGINSDLIKDTLSQYASDCEEEGSGEVDAASSILTKKFKSYDIEQNQKMYRFLASRGFNSDSIRKAINILKNSNTSSDEVGTY